MENQEMYIVSAEITAREDSDTMKKGEGAFLFSFVMETDADLAGIRVRNAFEEDGFMVEQIEEIILEDQFQWDEQDEEVIAECIKEAKENNDVVYGPFYVFDDEDSEDSEDDAGDADK